MNITAHTRYAIQALIEIAKSERPITMKSIANNGNIPKATLEKLLVKYRNAGLILSTRGSRGGHVLAVPAEDISMTDLIAVVENMDTTKCMGAANCQGGTRCNIHSLWHGLNRHIKNYFTNISLANMMISAQSDADMKPEFENDLMMTAI